MTTTMSGVARYRPATGRHYSESSNTVELPWLVPDTDFVMPSVGAGNQTWDCVDTAAFLNALNNAIRGDVIRLHAGTTYSVTEYVLRTLPGTGRVYIYADSVLDGTLGLTPSVYHQQGTQTQGQRVGPEHGKAALGAATKLANIESSNGKAIFYTNNTGGCSGYWFEGIEFTVNPTGYTGFNTGMIVIGYDGVGYPSSLANMPSDFHFGHCLIHSELGLEMRRGIAALGSWIGVRDCSIYHIHSSTSESAAIAGWNTPGPVSIINCFLSGGAQEVLWGGAGPEIPGLVQRNFTTKWCYLWKNPAWFSANGGNVDVKNHYEHKHGTHGLVEDCVFEHCSSDGQNGLALLFQTLNDENVTPASQKISDITIRNLKVFGGGPLTELVGVVGFSLQGEAIVWPEITTRRVLFENILCDSIAGTLAEASGTQGPAAQWVFQISNQIADIIIQHVTAEARTFLIDPEITARTDLYGTQSRRITLRNNLLGKGSDYCIHDNNTGQVDINAINADVAAGEFTFEKNVVYPTAGNSMESASLLVNTAANAYLPDVASVGFGTGYATGTPVALAAGSAFKGTGTDGKDPGADVAAIAAMVTAVKGTTTLPT